MEEQTVENNGASPLPPESSPGPPGKGEKSGKKKLVFWMSIALVSLLLIAGAMGGIYAWRFLKAANALTIDEVDMSRIPDGLYQGSYSVFHVKAAVEVGVEDGRVISIVFTDSGRISDETQQEIRDIFDEVISSQSLEVDITSGASVSKKVSLKAVEEALGGGAGGSP